LIKFIKDGDSARVKYVSLNVVKYISLNVVT